MKYSTFKYITVHYSTIQYNTVQYSTLFVLFIHKKTNYFIYVDGWMDGWMEYSTIQYNTVQYSTIQFNIRIIFTDNDWKDD